VRTAFPKNSTVKVPGDFWDAGEFDKEDTFIGVVKNGKHRAKTVAEKQVAGESGEVIGIKWQSDGRGVVRFHEYERFAKYATLLSK